MESLLIDLTKHAHLLTREAIFAEVELGYDLQQLELDAKRALGNAAADGVVLVATSQRRHEDLDLLAGKTSGKSDVPRKLRRDPCYGQHPPPGTVQRSPAASFVHEGFHSAALEPFHSTVDGPTTALQRHNADSVHDQLHPSESNNTMWARCRRQSEWRCNNVDDDGVRRDHETYTDYIGR